MVLFSFLLKFCRLQLHTKHELIECIKYLLLGMDSLFDVPVAFSFEMAGVTSELGLQRTLKLSTLNVMPL